MNMKPSIAAAALFAFFAGSLSAADPQLLSLVMPEAKVLAGINVDRAALSPFGQYVLGQLQGRDPQFQQLTAQTGFDPRRDVHELLFAGVPGTPSHLVLARGAFDPAKIAAAAQAGGGSTDFYKNITLVEDRQQVNGVAFLDSTLAIAGDIASVKAAIDRQAAPSPLSADVMVKVNQWSLAQDAWALSIVAPKFKAPATGSNVPAQALAGVVQLIQQGAVGIKLSADNVVTAQAQTNTPQDATSLAGALQLLVSLAQMQAAQNPQAAQAVSLLQSLVVNTSGNLLNVSLTVPEAPLEQLAKPKIRVGQATPERRAPRRRRQ